MLMIEWGLTEEQFEQISLVTLNKILAYKAAEANGKERAQAFANMGNNTRKR